MIKQQLIFLFRKVNYLFFFLLFIISNQCPCFSQISNADSTKPDSLKILTPNDSSNISIVEDTKENTTQVLKISSADSNLSITPPGKERLAINRKKTKFAYFDTTQSINRVIINNAFDVGEELTFAIRYGPIVAGSATMAIPKITKIKDRECYHIVTRTRSSKFFSAFFKVDDKVESFMDKSGLFSWRFEKHLREGKYRADQLVELDHIKRTAVTNGKDTLRIPPCVQDILTAFYYIRTLPMEIGKSIFIDNQADRKLYPLEILVHRKERIKTKAGTFDCIVIEPKLRGDAIFKQRGKLKIWITDDSRRIPVQMKSKVFIGSITAELKKFKGVLPINEQVKL